MRSLTGAHQKEYANRSPLHHTFQDFRDKFVGKQIYLIVVVNYLIMFVIGLYLLEISEAQVRMENGNTMSARFENCRK